MLDVELVDCVEADGLEQRDDGMYVDLNTDGLNAVREAAARREKSEQLMDEL